MKLFNIIMPMRNNLDLTNEAIKSLFETTRAEFNLVLIDNGSTEGLNIMHATLEACKYQSEHTGMGLIYHYNDTPLNFAASNNQGFDLAQVAGLEAEYTAFVNNDIIFTPGWDHIMVTGFSRVVKPGICGPVTNRISGPQMVTAPPQYKLPDHLKQWGDFIRNNNHASYKVHPNIRGFFMVMSSKLFFDMDGFDTEFNNAFDDDDLSIRVALEGYNNFINLEAFIYHHCSATVKKEYAGDQYADNMRRFRGKFIEKHGPHALIALFAKYGLSWEGI